MSRELDEKVARRLGWKIVPGNIPTLYEKSNKCVKANDLPAYSTDIQAAWEIVEKTECFELKLENGVWSCWMKGLRSNEYADTALLVICEAFLKLPEDKTI